MKKRILTMFWYDDAGEVHLFKDVGGIPYALAKYCGWKATFVYNDINGIIRNEEYEKYVCLDTIHYPKICYKLKLRYYKYLKVMKYVWNHAPEYDVINFYHSHRFIRFLCWLAKKSNPKIKTYVKLDMGRAGFEKEINQKNKHTVWENVSLFTVEANKYVGVLNTLDKFSGKVKYLPNGFFDELSENWGGKDNIILTVGRLGTYQKNTELLVNALLLVDKNLLKNWKIYLVGPVEPDFEKWFIDKLKNSPIKDNFILTGNISNKKELHMLYSKAAIFALPSRFEGFPLVLPEALHYGCYPIITDCFAGADEMVLSGYGDIIEADEKKWAAALSCAVNNKKQIGEKSAEFTEFINSNFNWRVIAQKLEAYFNECK